MTYEYEKYIKQSVQIELFRHGHHDYEDDGRVTKELEEVYAKAKAFNEIMDIYIKQGFVDYIEDVLIIWEDK